MKERHHVLVSALTVSRAWLSCLALVDLNFFLVPIGSSCCHGTALTLMMVQEQQQHDPFNK